MDKDIIRFICNNFCLFCKWNCCCYSVKCAGLSKFNRNYMSLLKIARPSVKFLSSDRRERSSRARPSSERTFEKQLYCWISGYRSISFKFFPMISYTDDWRNELIRYMHVSSLFFFFSFVLLVFLDKNFSWKLCREFSEFLEHRSQGNPR